jgi:hypothetical protein
MLTREEWDLLIPIDDNNVAVILLPFYFCLRLILNFYQAKKARDYCSSVIAYWHCSSFGTNP